MNYNQDRKKRLFKICTIILFVFLSFFTIISMKYNRQPTMLENIVKDTFSSVINVISKPFHYLEDKWSLLFQAEKILDEYQKLKEEVDGNEQAEDKNQTLKNEIKELKSLLDLKATIVDYEKINATVIHRNSHNWLEEFTIDKGKNEGIENDMAVVINDNLIGYVSNTSKYTSTIKLLTNTNLVNKISVKIEIKPEQYVYGLLYSFDDDNGVYILEGISDYKDIPVGSLVTTTGLTHKFPAGIIIGSVKSVNTDSYDLNKVVMVTPSIDINNIRYVSVLKREAISE